MTDFEALWQTSLHWQPTEAQSTLFERLYTGILAGNAQLNLTRITESEAFWEKHLWDSLSGIAPWLDAQWAKDWSHAWQQDGVSEGNHADLALRRVIDIGTGGGFPGMPIAIAKPQWQITLLDSTGKKMQFLQTLGEQLGLSNLRYVTERAESLGHHLQHREKYDLVCIRAVGSASTCAEYALPFLRLGGIAVLFRGQWNAQDSVTLAPALTQLGGSILAEQAWQTPLSQSVRHCLYLRKVAPSMASFPRAIGIPAKMPL
jgi:16S rRNA (guanine527-N7)-methyltransferase